MEPIIGLPLSYSEYWIAVWISAIAGAVAYLATSRSAGLKVAGFALMSVPVWTAVWGFINSIPALTDPGSFIPPRSTYRLSSTYIRTILIDIGYLGTGFLLWTAHMGWPRSAREVAKRLHAAGLTWGRSEAKDAWAGWVWFPVLLIGTAGLDWLVRNQTPALINGDESQVWRNMTVYHVVIISAAAAFTEELTYRVLLLLAARHAFTRLGVAATPALWSAVALQAVVFGLAHGGYGTIYHVLGPLIFGLIAGFAAVRFGIWSAVMLHFLVDIYAFGVHAAQNAPWVWNALWALLVANVAVSIYAGVMWFAARAGRKDAPPASGT